MTYSKSLGKALRTFDWVYFDVVILHTDTSRLRVMVYHSRLGVPFFSFFISCSLSSG